MSPVADDSAFAFKQLSQVKYSDTNLSVHYSVRNNLRETKKLTSVEVFNIFERWFYSFLLFYGFTLFIFFRGCYCGYRKTDGELDQSITDAGQGVQDKIESQFDTSQGSEVGSAAQGFADQAAESLGVVSYV